MDFTTFQEITYTRPDFEARKEELRRYAQDLKNAGSYDELKAIFLKHD